jgi:hypothetical protein
MIDGCFGALPSSLTESGLNLEFLSYRSGKLMVVVGLFSIVEVLQWLI